MTISENLITRALFKANYSHIDRSRVDLIREHIKTDEDRKRYLDIGIRNDRGRDKSLSTIYNPLKSHYMLVIEAKLADSLTIAGVEDAYIAGMTSLELKYKTLLEDKDLLWKVNGKVNTIFTMTIYHKDRFQTDDIEEFETRVRDSVGTLGNSSVKSDREVKNNIKLMLDQLKNTGMAVINFRLDKTGKFRPMKFMTFPGVTRIIRNKKTGDVKNECLDAIVPYKENPTVLGDIKNTRSFVSEQCKQTNKNMCTTRHDVKEVYIELKTKGESLEEFSSSLQGGVKTVAISVESTSSEIIDYTYDNVEYEVFEIVSNDFCLNNGQHSTTAHYLIFQECTDEDILAMSRDIELRFDIKFVSDSRLAKVEAIISNSTVDQPTIEKELNKIYTDIDTKYIIGKYNESPEYSLKIKPQNGHDTRLAINSEYLFATFTGSLSIVPILGTLLKKGELSDKREKVNHCSKAIDYIHPKETKTFKEYSESEQREIEIAQLKFDFVNATSRYRVIDSKSVIKTFTVKSAHGTNSLKEALKSVVENDDVYTLDSIIRDYSKKNSEGDVLTNLKNMKRFYSVIKSDYESTKEMIIEIYNDIITSWENNKDVKSKLDLIDKLCKTTKIATNVYNTTFKNLGKFKSTPYQTFMEMVAIYFETRHSSNILEHTVEEFETILNTMVEEMRILLENDKSLLEPSAWEKTGNVILLESWFPLYFPNDDYIMTYFS